MARAQLDADERGRLALGPPPGLVDGVDDGRVTLGEAGGPAEDRDLDAMRRQAVVEAERRQQRRGPRAGDEHDRSAWRSGPRCVSTPVTRPPSASDPRGFDAGLDRRPPVARRLGEREGGGGGVGEAGVGLPGGGADVGELAAGQDLADLGRRDHACVDAQALLARHVAGQRLRVLGADQLHEAHALEAAVAADDLAEVPEDLQALEGHAGLGLVGVVHAHERARLAGGAGRQLTALEQHDVAHAQQREVEGGAGAVGAPADDDDVRGRFHGVGILASAATTQHP